MAAQSSNDGTAAGHRRGEVSGSSSRAENPFLDPAPSRRRSADDLENPFRGSTAASSQISLGLASGAASSNGDERRDLLASLPNRVSNIRFHQAKFMAHSTGSPVDMAESQPPSKLL